MSIRAINWASHLGECEEVTPTMRHILKVLANFAGDEDTCFPRQSIIARITGLKRPTVCLNLGYLEDLGLIEKTGRTQPNGATRSSEYKLLIDENPAVDQKLFYKDAGNCPRFVPRVRQTNTPGVHQDDSGCFTDEHPGVREDDSGCSSNEQEGVRETNTLNLNLEPSPEPKDRTRPKPRKTAPWPADYRKQFWDAYRKKVGKKDAIIKLDRLEKEDRIEFETIMTGLTRYMAHTKDWDKHYIMAPEVFLNGERWDDEFDAGPKKPPPSKRMAI